MPQRWHSPPALRAPGSRWPVARWTRAGGGGGSGGGFAWGRRLPCGSGRVGPGSAGCRPPPGLPCRQPGAGAAPGPGAAEALVHRPEGRSPCKGGRGLLLPNRPVPAAVRRGGRAGRQVPLPAAPPVSLCLPVRPSARPSACLSRQVLPAQRRRSAAACAFDIPQPGYT